MASSLSTWLLSAWDAALNFIFPPVCQVCRGERAGIHEGYVGGKCWSQVRFVMAPFCRRCGLPYDGRITHPFVCGNCRDVRFHFQSARSAAVANPLLLHIIHRYKYDHALCFEAFLADLLIRQAAPVLEKETWDKIVPVPLHPAKLREREFNQAERLARRLAAATGISIDNRLIRRIKPTATQTHLNRQERAGNMLGAFATRAGRQLNGEKIILLDDVLTTGATTSACARVLRKAGAGEVCVWTVARGA